MDGLDDAEDEELGDVLPLPDPDADGVGSTVGRLDDGTGRPTVGDTATNTTCADGTPWMPTTVGPEGDEEGAAAEPDGSGETGAVVETPGGDAVVSSGIAAAATSASAKPPAPSA